MHLNVQSHEIHATLFETNRRSFCLICVSGSEGGLLGATLIARAFHKQGIPALAVAYFKTLQTPPALCEIPIEVIKRAVSFLKQRGYTRIGIYGLSKGAELALLSATLIQDLSSVIVASPACCVFEGFTPGKMPAGRSSWTWRGTPLPYVPMAGLSAELLRAKKRNHSFGFSAEYGGWLDASFSEKNAIPAEQIRGPILLLSARNDEMWPSERMGEMVAGRLAQFSFAYPFHHEVFRRASHLLAPVDLPYQFIFQSERANHRTCSMARRAAFEMAVSWIQEYGRPV